MAEKILIVEDDSDAALALSIQLEAEGFQILKATDVASAISMAKSQLPDLILLDLGLPDGEGYKVLQRLVSGSISSAPVIVVTARGSEKDHHRALELGAVDFFQKPVPSTWLLRAIQRALIERHPNQPSLRSLTK